nr:RNA exonuclease 4-like [Physcomitrium patens]|eukprot:XP_024384936.1 RNA exonuclease 4-like [Physcomitrella patens]
MDQFDKSFGIGLRNGWGWLRREEKCTCAGFLGIFLRPICSHILFVSLTEGFSNSGVRLSAKTKVNQWGNLVYDKYVRPQEYVQDFRTAVSGVRSRDLRKAQDLYTVQKEVMELLKGRVLVGHAVHNDLKVLMLTHSKSNGRPRSLQHLASLHLGAKIQEGEHNSVEDARAAMALYQRVKDEWERSLREKNNKSHEKEKLSGGAPAEKGMKSSKRRK